MKKITIAHSPDADDIFMYMAIKFGWIGNDFAYE
ncbi:S-ribosylhomocysteine lyase, partial [Campylobacter jejuni]